MVYSNWKLRFVIAKNRIKKLTNMLKFDHSIKLTNKLKKELNKLKYRKIDLSDPDAPEIKEWQDAVRGKFYRQKI